MRAALSNPKVVFVLASAFMLCLVLFRAIQNRARIGILNWLVSKGGALRDCNNAGQSAFAVAIINKNAPDVLR